MEASDWEREGRNRKRKRGGGGGIFRYSLGQGSKTFKI